MAAGRTAIRVEQLWKTYHLRPPGARRGWLRPPPVEFHALRGVDLEVTEGTVLGVIGRNGAGKSTLLKVLSRITDPTRGRVTVYGRVASLLEVGTGFHPELTGRENVYLNAAIHNMRRRAVTACLPSIIEFAQIGEFLDEPVKRYSSGMYLRLAFSIAAHLEPDILIVDEVLAVGDVQFQAKCLQRVKDISRTGRTVVLVSHDMIAVRGLCSRVAWIDDGAVRMTGEAVDVLRAYQRGGATAESAWRPVPQSDAVLQFTQVVLRDAGGVECGGIVQGGDPFEIQMDYVVKEPGVAGRIMLRITSDDGADVLWSASTDTMSSMQQSIRPGRFRTRCLVPAHLLAPGRYRLCVEEPLPEFKARWHDNVIAFAVSRGTGLGARDGRGGVVMPLLHWQTAALEEAPSVLCSVPDAPGAERSEGRDTPRA